MGRILDGNGKRTRGNQCKNSKKELINSSMFNGVYVHKLVWLAFSDELISGLDILHNKEGLKAAVIVNDMSEVNIDADLVKNENTLSRTEETLVEMSNGCICCTLREDLMIEVEKLAKAQKFDYLIIESTGISEPIPVAQTFSFESEDGTIDLSKFSYVDTMVTVVDGYNFFKDFGSPERLVDRELSNIEGDDRTIVTVSYTHLTLPTKRIV